MPIDLVDALRRDLTAVADPAKAVPMAAYMKDRFRFLGVAAPARKAAQKPFIAAGRGASAEQLLGAAEMCWSLTEREFQYAGTDLLVRWTRALDAGDLPRIEALVRTRSWWDTVDALAANVIGPIVAAEPEAASVMDRWIDDADIWVARTAILHQLKYRDATDVDRLFGYVDRRAADSEFFIRKALGWALREFAKTDADAVALFVHERGNRLSGLTRREALRHL